MPTNDLGFDFCMLLFYCIWHLFLFGRSALAKIAHRITAGAFADRSSGVAGWEARKRGTAELLALPTHTEATLPTAFGALAKDERSCQQPQAFLMHHAALDAATHTAAALADRRMTDGGQPGKHKPCYIPPSKAISPP